MAFSKRLAALRKERGLSQQALAEATGIHVTQIKRYEAGTSQPSLEAIKGLATHLRVSADTLVFDEAERGPDEELKLQFDAIRRMEPKDKNMIKTILDALILKNEAKRWTKSD